MTKKGGKFNKWELLRYIPKHEKQFASQHISKLDTLIERLCLDNVCSKVTDERYEKMSVKFEAAPLLISGCFFTIVF